MKTSITLTVEQVAQEIADHKRLRIEDFYDQERYSGILFGIKCLVGKEIYSQAMAIAKEIVPKKS